MDFVRWHRLHQCGAFCDIRARQNFRCARRYSRPVNKTTGLRFDQTVVMTGLIAQHWAVIALGGIPNKVRVGNMDRRIAGSVIAKVLSPRKRTPVRASVKHKSVLPLPGLAGHSSADQKLIAGN